MGFVGRVGFSAPGCQAVCLIPALPCSVVAYGGLYLSALCSCLLSSSWVRPCAYSISVRLLCAAGHVAASVVKRRQPYGPC